MEANKLLDSYRLEMGPNGEFYKDGIRISIHDLYGAVDGKEFIALMQLQTAAQQSWRTQVLEAAHKASKLILDKKAFSEIVRQLAQPPFNRRLARLIVIAAEAAANHVIYVEDLLEDMGIIK